MTRALSTARVRLGLILAALLAVVASLVAPATPAQAAIYYTPKFVVPCYSDTAVRFLAGTSEVKVWGCTSKYILNAYYAYNQLGFGGRCVDKYGYLVGSWGAGSGWSPLNERARWSGNVITCETW